MSFAFTALPPEIRNRIYDLALCLPGEICPTGAGIHNRWQHTDAAAAKDLTINSALLRTTKQLHAEATPILYGNNHFAFIDGPTPLFATAWDLVGMYAFFVIVGRRNRLCIRHLTIRLTKTSNAAYFSYQRNARELGESLALLSTGHGIRVLRIEFADGTRARERGLAYLNFWSGKRLVANLERVKGVGRLEIAGDVDEVLAIAGKTHEVRIKELMEVMEVGVKREGEVDGGVDERADGGRVVGAKISDRLRRLEEEREELRVTVARLEGRVEEMQRLSKALSGMEELRKKVEDLANLI